MEAMMAMQIVGAVVGAAGTIMGGNAANDAAKAQAKQYEAAAGRERAIASRDVSGEKRKGVLAGSRAQNMLAASGGSSTDASSLDIEGSIAAETEYNALMALSDGEYRAQQLEYGGALKRYEGKQAKSASRWAAASTLLGSGMSMAEKYGGGGGGMGGFAGAGGGATGSIGIG